MSVSLKKGQRVSLKKEDASLNKLMVGLGWDPTKRGQDADLDASVFEVNQNGSLMKFHIEIWSLMMKQSNIMGII
jgi:tellurium resistance protein TerD